MVRTGYHLVDISPWPFSAALGVLGMASSLVGFIHLGPVSFVKFSMMFSLILFVMTLVRWWCDLVIESTYLGCYTKLVVRNMRVGMILFLMSEGFFFVSFFWAFFNAGVGEASMIGVGQWPPVGIKAIYPFKIPALNTAILIGSGITVTWAHKALKHHNMAPIGGDVEGLLKLGLYKEASEYEEKRRWGEYRRKEALFSLGVTILLGFYFMWVQYNEYMVASYTMADGVYGSTFYIMTGFHGSHVIAGIIFLCVSWVRLYLYHFSHNHHHFGFDASVWYWHFVDGVWVALYGVVYIWGYF